MSGYDPTVDAASAGTSLPPAPAGRTLGRYVIERLLGEGGMGAVYLANDPQLGRKVALKVLRAADVPADANARLTREARMMAALVHPNIVTVHDVGEANGQTFIAMEFVEGQTLTSWLAMKPRGTSEIVAAFRVCGEALAKAHELGIVHRDFKPDNVLVGHDGRIAVTDFGIATTGAGHESSTPSGSAAPPKVLSLTRTGMLLGTPAYMSPEQLLGRRADAPSDQFSFAVALWEALYDKAPFDGDTFEQLRANVIGTKFSSLPTLAKRRVPANVHRALVRAMSRVPDQRFPSMRALLAAFEPRRSGTLRWLLGTLGIVLATTLAVFVASRPRGTAQITLSPSESRVTHRPHGTQRFTAVAADAKGRKRDITEIARWSVKAASRGRGSFARPGVLDYDSPDIYEVSAELDGVKSVTKLDVRPDRLDVGIAVGKNERPPTIDAEAVNVQVRTDQVFGSPREEHSVGLHTSVLMRDGVARNFVHVGYVVSASFPDPVAFYSIDYESRHEAKGQRLAPNTFVRFSLRAAGEARPDGLYDWEAAMQPEGGAPVVIGRFQLGSKQAEPPSAKVFVVSSDDACLARYDVLVDVPVYQHDGGPWTPFKHIRGWETKGHCPQAGTKKAGSRLEIQLPANGGCTECELY